MDVELIVAFVGGLLALLSPCSALLLPAFFVSIAGTGEKYAAHALVFYLGLITLLIPLGVGISAVGSMLVVYRTQVIIGASILMILFGLMQMLGFGFDLGNALPGSDNARQRAQRATGWGKSYLMGVTSGLGGFCAGPILGALLTMSFGQGNVLVGAALMAMYGAGMVVPLIVIVMLWNVIGEKLRHAIHGRPITILGRTTSTTSILTGALIVVVGILFWITGGFVNIPWFISTDWLYDVQNNLDWLSHPVIRVLLIVAVAAVVLFFWIRRRSK